MEAWHISIILGKPVNPITAVDYFDEHQQEPAVKWQRAFKRKHAHDSSIGIDAKASKISHILHCANVSGGEDIHGTFGASV